MSFMLEEQIGYVLAAAFGIAVIALIVVAIRNGGG